MSKIILFPLRYPYMKGDSQIFRFKRFLCSHGRSAMKIGADAILLGAWCRIPGNRILDVGTGCGILALMCAQKNPYAHILAIDIDGPSISEALENFGNSPWSGRLDARLMDFREINSAGKFDLVISNPPFFKAGIEHPETSRLIARHDGALSPLSLIHAASCLLDKDGILSMVTPFDRKKDILQAIDAERLAVTRMACVRGHSQAPVKRILWEISKSFPDTGTEISTIVLNDSKGDPTPDYKSLCHDFYLHF